MKEIKKFLPFIALFMAAAAFVLSFFATLQIVQYGVHAEFKNIIWGCKQVTIEGTVRTIKETFGFESSGIAPLPFIGLVMMLVGAIASVILTLFVKNKFTKWIVLGCSALILAGGIIYSIGAILYGIGHKNLNFHCIFHVFVLLSTIVQAIGVLLIYS